MVSERYIFTSKSVLVIRLGHYEGSSPGEVDFFSNLPNPSSRTVALGSIQLLTEMRTRNLLGDKERPTREADNLAAICESTV
jgi:hypothetical protein